MLVFGKIRQRLGGRVRWILSGSAPLDPALAEFLRICFSCPVMEGYGLTENFAGASIARLNETTTGHVGTPLSCTEFKLQDVPEMKYLSTNNPPCGEVMIRGRNVFRGYLKQPKETEEALEKDGWFHTGDIGRWNENGTLSIIDRKKNIFKLSQGEYVAVEYLEGVLGRCKLVGQIWVYGSSLKSYLVSVVVPNWDAAKLWAQQNNVTFNQSEIIKNEAFNKAVLEGLTATGKASSLKGFEFVKGVILFEAGFSVENDLTTPTFKLRRPQLKEFFLKQIDELYKKIGDL